MLLSTSNLRAVSEAMGGLSTLQGMELLSDQFSVKNINSEQAIAATSMLRGAWVP